MVFLRKARSAPPLPDFSSLQATSSQELPSSSSRGANRRQVQFDLTRNVTIERRHSDGVDSDLWYNRNDWKSFKQETWTQAKKVVAKRRSGGGEGTEGVKKTSCGSEAVDYVYILERTYERCKEIKSEKKAAIFHEQKKDRLRSILEIALDAMDDGNDSSDGHDTKSSCGKSSFGCDDILGMDNLILPRVRADRAERRDKLVETVTHLQYNSSLSDEEKIRRKCERISQPARTFAQIIAAAHATS